MGTPFKRRVRPLEGCQLFTESEKIMGSAISSFCKIYGKSLPVCLCVCAYTCIYEYIHTNIRIYVHTWIMHIYIYVNMEYLFKYIHI